jgi:hypothetical protein
MESEELAPDVRLILALRATDEHLSRGQMPHIAIHHAAKTFKVDEEELRGMWTRKRLAVNAARKALEPVAEEPPTLT